MLQSNTTFASKEVLERLKTKSPKHYQKLVDLFNERREILDSSPAKYFIPNGKAEEFIKLVGANKHFVNMLSELTARARHRLALIS